MDNPGPKVAVGCGSLLLFLAFCVSAFGAFHVFVDPHGAISADEAMPALAGGVLCMFVDVIIVGVGIALWMRGGASQNAGGVPPVGSMPGLSSPGMSSPGMTAKGTQVMDQNSLPGAPPSAFGGGSLPGAGPMGAMPASAQPQQPWHLLTGCLTLGFVVTLCLAGSGILYFNSEVEHWQSNLESDRYGSYDPYGYGGGYGGADPLIIAIDESAIEENQQYEYASSCCCLFSFFLAFALGGATVRLVMLRRRG